MDDTAHILSPEEMLVRDRHITLENSALSRPKATNTAYKGKQIEFKQWCAASGFADGDTVTGDKINR